MERGSVPTFQIRDMDYDAGLCLWEAGTAEEALLDFLQGKLDALRSSVGSLPQLHVPLERVRSNGASEYLAYGRRFAAVPTKRAA